ncbi:glycosyltransferase [Psychrobacter sanguinis]|uniref:glycosyltransferase n=1 Tax=Psychrobacter sanguinis TaxID=861445 RepID=UPI0028971203|nr:glycosyltransferase [Psychrobacter sanguinis]
MSKTKPLYKTVLINASNLHTGGGVQVAISFLYELSLMSNTDLSYIHIVASDEVNIGLEKLNAVLNGFGHYEVLNTYGLRALNSKLNKKIKHYELVFTVFGPNYLRLKSKKEIVGFAQLWILNFSNPISKNMRLFSRYKLRLKLSIQWLFFLRSDHYIVELEHVKNSLHKLKGIPFHNISVVHNTVSSLYINENKWSCIKLIKGQEDISLGIITRDYPHKNLNILPYIAQSLELNHNLKVHFYTTLNNEEWSTKSIFFKTHVSTTGSLRPDQCPSFYQQVDGVIFPSLLECFSATPLEAMVMEKPLFASNRNFVRDVCQNHAIYIDPLDADDIAYKIAEYFKPGTENKAKLRLAKEYALNFSSAEERAIKYLEIINNHLEEYTYVQE